MPGLSLVPGLMSFPGGRVSLVTCSRGLGKSGPMFILGGQGKISRGRVSRRW